MRENEKWATKQLRPELHQETIENSKRYVNGRRLSEVWKLCLEKPKRRDANEKEETEADSGLKTNRDDGMQPKNTEEVFL